MRYLRDLRKVLQLDQSETGLSGLHPRLAEKARQAMATLEEMVSFSEGNHISTLGIDPMNLSAVASVFFAALDRTGAKAQDLGYRPQVGYLGRRVERFEVPSPMVITVGSETSARVALVVVVFTDYNAAGYGDWQSAYGEVAGIFSDMESATQRLRELVNAVKTLDTALDEMNRPEAKSTPKYGPSF